MAYPSGIEMMERYKSYSEEDFAALDLKEDYAGQGIDTPVYCPRCGAELIYYNEPSIGVCKCKNGCIESYTLGL